MNVIQKLKIKAKDIKSKLLIIYYAYINPKLSLLPKLLIGLTILYALSPIDLIPDFIPILGYLDDLIIVPLLLTISIKLIPESIYQEAIKLAEKEPKILKKNWTFGLIFIALWLCIVLLLFKLLIK